MSGDRPVPHPRTSRAPMAGTETAAGLSARLTELRARRLDDETRAAQLPTLLRAIALSLRDRDTGSSPRLSDHRAALERIWAEVEDLVVATARVAVRVHLHTVDPDDPLVPRARRAITHSQAALREFAEVVNRR
ncbi:MAG: hypothetical protein WA890_30455 [Micromonospora sp.]